MQAQSSVSGSSHRPLYHLVLILILSLSAFIQFTVVSRTTVIFPFGADAADYFSYAYNLHKHSTYSVEPTWSSAPRPQPPVRDSLRPPGYPLFLAMVGTPEASRAFERRVVYIQAALGVLSVLLVYLIASTFVGPFPSLFVAVLIAINPHFATISTYLLTESLFMFLLLASTFSLLKAVGSKQAWLFAATGVLWGITSLVRSTVEFLPVLALLGVLALPRLRSHRPKAILAFACFALVMSPWVIRNQSSDLKASSSVLMVNTLVHGSYPDFKYENQPQSFGFPYRFDPNLANKSRDLPSALRYIATQFRDDFPKYAEWYLVGKPIYFLSWAHVQGFDILVAPVNYTPYYQDIRFAVMRAISFYLHWPAMIFGLVGILLLWLRPTSLGLSQSERICAILVTLVVVYAIAFHIVAAPFPRYGIPFRPLLYALAALPLRALWLQLKRRRSAVEQTTRV